MNGSRQEIKENEVKVGGTKKVHTPTLVGVQNWKECLCVFVCSFLSSSISWGFLGPVRQNKAWTQRI